MSIVESGGHCPRIRSLPTIPPILTGCPKPIRCLADRLNLISDIDLSILGASPEDYAAYRDAIRCEYSAVPEGKFTAGRLSILRRFLSQRIYTTAFFEQLEKQARLNIQEEIESLNAG